MSTLLNKAKEDAVVEFRAFKKFTDLLDTNYITGFKDFHMDVMENFPEVDFSSIKLNLGATTSSLSSRRALKILTLKMMPPLCLPRTSLTLEMTPHSEDIKF